MSRSVSRLLLSCLFIGAGVMHFVTPKTYLKVMPPYLPYPLALIGISGAAEIAGGLGVLLPATRKVAGYGLIALLIAVFPANIHMALHGTRDVGIDVPRAVWWARLPFQALFIWWVWEASLKQEPL